ncbi:MAG: (4Fe-4S)-binding protein [Crocinitomix sp.]|nr:(4Fe-4S)-binding protein [Crocinitomix sp.]
MDNEIIKEYSNEELTIVWKPKTCIHAGECIKALPNAYQPKEKPWIITGNATSDEFKAQIAKCPSGALSYYINDDKKA